MLDLKNLAYARKLAGGGGGDISPPVIQPLSVTKNGTYNRPAGTDGFNPVTVNVPEPVIPEPVIEPLSVTENGTYNPAEGTDGFGTVTVNVPTPAPVTEPLNVTENGTYTPDAGVDGFSPVTVNVQASGGDDWYITDASHLFRGGARLELKDILLQKLKDPANMSHMFNGCTNLTALDVSSWDTSKVTTMVSMFDGCAKLAEITGFSATNKAGMSITFPLSYSSSTLNALKRLTFRTDLPDGKYSIRSPINIKNCSFDRDGMVEMFNTLPDISGLGLSSSYTTITITGNPCVTDGTLTAEDEAIATSKGWTLVK